MTCKPFRVTVALAALFLGAARADADLIVTENTGNDTLRLSDTGALLTTFAGNGQNSPVGVALDAARNVYVVNQGTDSVSKFSPTGAPLGFFVQPDQPNNPSPLSTPIGITFDPAGNAYVTSPDTFTPSAPGPGFINKFDPAGNNLGFFGAGPTNPTSVPTGIGYNPVNGLLYVSNAGNNQVYTYNPANLSAGATVLPIAAGLLDNPEQIAFDAAGNVYIASFGRTSTLATVREFTAAGALIRTFTPTGGGTGAGAEGVAVDPNGNVFVSLFNRGTIERFSAAGGPSTIIASGLRSPGFLQFVNPQAVPEPGSLALAGVALLGAAGYHLRRRRQGVRAA